jgi:Chromo (CHRromatin Organisation MOdifier) domain
MRLSRYFTYKNTSRYIDVLPDILNSYNNTYHRSIGMAPNDVTESNSLQVAERLYPPKPTKFNFKYKINDCVGISYTRQIFRKGYNSQWSDEIFSITELYPSVPVTYGLTDAGGERIKGRFYETEIQLVTNSPDDVYVIEKIIKKRKRDGQTEYFVKWLAFGNKENSWVRDVIRV